MQRARLLPVLLMLFLCGACADSVRRAGAEDGQPAQEADGGLPQGDADQAAPASFSEFCQRYAEVWCGGHLSCCTDSGERYADVAACEKGTLDYCRTVFADPIYGGCVPYSPGAARAYLDKLRQLIPSCGVDTEFYNEIFEGVVPPGGACTYARDDLYPLLYCCQPGARCVASDVAGNTVNAACQGGLKQVGEPCLTTPECAAGICEGDPASGGRRCVALRPVGAGCTSAYECASRHCENGVCGTMDANSYYCGKPGKCIQVGHSIYADGSDCVASYRCVGKERLTVRCRHDGGTMRCTCERNAVEQKTFSSASICQLGGDELRAAVRTGCGWSEL